MSETPSEDEVWVPERRTRVSRSSVLRGASVLEPLYRTTAGRDAAEGLHRDAPAPTRRRTSEEALSARALSRGSSHARKRRREHGPDRDTPHGDRGKGPQAVARGVELVNGQHPNSAPADDVAVLEARPRRRAAGLPGCRARPLFLRPARSPGTG